MLLFKWTVNKVNHHPVTVKRFEASVSRQKLKDQRTLCNGNVSAGVEESLWKITRNLAVYLNVNTYSAA